MQNLRELRVGETVEIEHPSRIWKGVVTVIKSGPDFRCTIPILTHISGDAEYVKEYFQNLQGRGWVHLGTESLWKITDLQLEND